jgi:hypothetical protein
MNGRPQGSNPQCCAYPGENSNSCLTWLGLWRARRKARQHERLQRQRDQQRAWEIEDIICGCGLSQTGHSIAGGSVVHIPQVVSLDAGPPETVDIRILPGQRPDDFAAHAPTIAYNLGLSKVRVIALEPFLIRLELLS